MDKHVDQKHVGKGTAKQTINRLISSGKLHQRKKQIGFGNRNVITIDGQDFMYDRNKEMSNKLFKYVVKHIPYESDDEVFKRVRLNQKTRVIQSFLKKKVANIKEKKIVSVNKIINHLKRNPKFIVTETKEALRGKAKIISLRPKILGGVITVLDLPFLIFQSYRHVLKQINYNDFRVSCTVNANLIDGSEFWAATEQHQKKYFKNVFHEILRKIELGMEKYDEIDLSTLEIIYKFIDIPTGGSGTTSRDKLSILNKSSVIQIRNNDNNCFWYALALQIYRNHKCYNEIRKGRPIRTKVAKELCETCGCEWDVPVSFDDMVYIEPILNANVYVVGMDQIPLLGDTCNIYNTLLYKSEKKGATQQFWFLYDEHDDGSGHFHAITDIKGFMGVRYFCSKCLGCFTHNTPFDKHACSEHPECRGCITKHNSHQLSVKTYHLF